MMESMDWLKKAGSKQEAEGKSCWWEEEKEKEPVGVAEPEETVEGRRRLARKALGPGWGGAEGSSRVEEEELGRREEWEERRLLRGVVVVGWSRAKDNEDRDRRRWKGEGKGREGVIC